MDVGKKRSVFSLFSRKTSRVLGQPIAFVLAVAVVIVWALLGPVFGYSDTWQLVINTATTIVTFLMVFLIQNTQNRDTEALQIKLDELIRSTGRAHNSLLDLEEMEEAELDALRQEYEALAQQARQKLEYKSQHKNSPSK
jgi:low affinity Fe/Cu permease